MKTVQDIRRALKPKGYNVKTKTFSFGRSMTFFNNITKKEVPSIFSTVTLQEWQPLLLWLKEHEVEIQIIKKSIR